MSEAALPVESIGAAECLLGVAHTEAEQAMMAESIAAKIDLAL